MMSSSNVEPILAGSDSDGRNSRHWNDTLPDPPGPNPARCHEVDAKMAEALAESPYRSVIMASSIWSHCFLSPSSGYVVPDFESDRMMLDALGNSKEYDNLAYFLASDVASYITGVAINVDGSSSLMV